MWVHARRRVGDPAGSAGGRLGVHYMEMILFAVPPFLCPLPPPGPDFAYYTNFSGGRGSDFTYTNFSGGRGLDFIYKNFSGRRGLDFSYTKFRGFGRTKALRILSNIEKID